MKTPKSQLTAKQPLTEKTHTYQKRYSTPKDKEAATVGQQEGHFHNRIKSHTCQIGNPQTGKQFTRVSPMKGKVAQSETSFLEGADKVSMHWDPGQGNDSIKA